MFVKVNRCTCKEQIEGNVKHCIKPFILLSYDPLQSIYLHTYIINIFILNIIYYIADPLQYLSKLTDVHVRKKLKEVLYIVSNLWA